MFTKALPLDEPKRMGYMSEMSQIALKIMTYLEVLVPDIRWGNYYVLYIIPTPSRQISKGLDCEEVALELYSYMRNRIPNPNSIPP